LHHLQSTGTSHKFSYELATSAVAARMRWVVVKRGLAQRPLRIL